MTSHYQSVLCYISSLLKPGSFCYGEKTPSQFDISSTKMSTPFPIMMFFSDFGNSMNSMPVFEHTFSRAEMLSFAPRFPSRNFFETVHTNNGRFSGRGTFTSRPTHDFTSVYNKRTVLFKDALDNNKKLPKGSICSRARS